MFKATQFLKNVYKLSEFAVQKSFKNPVIQLQIVNNSSFYNKISYYCTQAAENEFTIEGLNKAVNIQEITNGDPDIQKKLQIIVLEADVMRQDGGKVPDILFLKTQHWKELVNKPSRSQRKKYLEFLFKIEKKQENVKLKKEKSREEKENQPAYEDDGHIRYGLNYNTFLIRIYDTTINQLYNNKLVNAMQFGQKLVVDCGYDEHMVTRESNNCAKQIMLMFAENRMYDDPFDLHLCNAEPTAPTMSALHKHIATMYDPSFPLNIHKGSYLDLFPKENLVYLTPHCREELKEYDHDSIYIIGGIVDKINNEPVSLAKAKKEGLKMAKLPLDRYLQWGSGSGKSLTLNCMLNILQDVKSTGNWKHALRHVPKRKTAEQVYSFGGDRHSLRYDKSEFRKTLKPNRIFSGEKSNKKPNDFVKKLLENR